MKKKYFKEWAYDIKRETKQVGVIVHDIKGHWVTVGTIDNCEALPEADFKDMDEWVDFDDMYNDKATELIDKAGYESIWLKERNSKKIEIKVEVQHE